MEQAQNYKSDLDFSIFKKSDILMVDRFFIT
jgi:hypothetical protein